MVSTATVRVEASAENTRLVTPSAPLLSRAGSYMASEARAAVERQHGNLGTSLLIDPDAGAAGFESFWASDYALVDSEDVIAANAREAGQRAGATVTAERYEVVVFEREAPLRGGQGVRVTPVNAGPSQLSTIEDAIAWYGDTAVPVLAADRCRTPRRSAT